MKVCPQCGLEYRDDEARCYIDRAELVDQPDPCVGVVLMGRYRVEAVLGEGGMAKVYRAQNTLVAQPVAVKIMNRRLANDEALRERFRREAKNAAAVAHPHIIEIHDYGEMEDGTPFLVMELLDGETLSDRIERGRLSPGEVAGFGLQVAWGLARAHDFDVLHRDLKPENIFLSRDERGVPSHVKLLDFGIARSMHDTRLTSAGQIFGTPEYMAPERVTTNDAGPAADLYSFGCILFEMATGRLPFESKDLPGFFIQHLQTPPPPPRSFVPELPQELEDLILQLLAKEPQDRPVDAHAVARVLAPMAPTDLRRALATRAEAREVTVAAGVSSASRTLPPVTVEDWVQRSLIFREMLERAFPAGDVPEALVDMLGRIRGNLVRSEELRSEGLGAQRALEVIEGRAREGRERLGHAVQILGEDLSRAREEARTATAKVAPYLEPAREAEAAFREAQERVRALADDPKGPPDALMQATADLEAAAKRWIPLSRAARDARRWLAPRTGAVEDLQFQVEALRRQLEAVEAEYEEARSEHTQRLDELGTEIGEIEQRLTDIGARFMAPLRGRPELAELVRRLETERHASLPVAS
jgi:tRNA A-37 threonylcarbamoyl transferase component Bud32